MPQRTPEITNLTWADVPAGAITLPRGAAPITLGLGSALARRPGDPPGRVFALGDRGPNLKLSEALSEFGLMAFQALDAPGAAKIMPRLELGPTICELQVEGDGVRLVRTLPLRRPDGGLVTGAPPPHAIAAEPAFDLAARPIAPDPDGADTEGLAALLDGTFWVAEEYGPSLLRVAADGTVRERWTPPGRAARGARIPQRPLLPRLAAARRPNRGFEALALSPDETRLHVAFQSALETPGEPDDQVRIWTLDAASGALVAEHAYRFDPPDSFLRDAEAGPVDAAVLKICDAVLIGPSRLLVLERISRSAKLYLVTLEAAERGEPAPAGPLPPLRKMLLFSTDEHRQIAPDLEGVAMLSDRELLLVTDNDFGLGGAATAFYRLRFDDALD
ncbi:esterase-like activity of phytase family protein [Phenylobacterium sp.]|jgi:hypothetical protein|uniref:esterase-like activity of phytase family protein n=1 Tax=Phenylobacterium sp. TaxID=1871053 RepID=UPI002E3058F4|nr:esterase-like activity of phytase family protein [Phenylobacterium sp.]HEX2561120.1 esterase-like activity of phytase family protein [Phenylobacterium sp.]